MTVQLQDDTRPAGTVGPDGFSEQADAGTDEFWGVPLEYFTIEDGEVFLASRLASELEWTIDERVGDTLNIAATAQTVTVDGREITVNPGFWCSHVNETDIQH